VGEGKSEQFACEDASLEVKLRKTEQLKPPGRKGKKKELRQREIRV
jgi:hypothetical protein